MSAAKVLEEDSVLRVDVGRGRDGVYFTLYPLSKDYLRRTMPGIRLRPRVFIARETESDFQTLDTSLQQQVIQLLTGLSLDLLRRLTPEVEFVDVIPDHEPVLARLDPAQALASQPNDSGVR